MLKTLKFFLYLNISILLLFIITACVLQSIDYYSLAPFWKGVHNSIFRGIKEVSDYELGVYVGQLIIPLILPFLGLIAIKKKSYKLSIITLILFILFTLSSLARGSPSIIGIIIIILFLTKPVKNYFKINK